MLLAIYLIIFENKNQQPSEKTIEGVFLESLYKYSHAYCCRIITKIKFLNFFACILKEICYNKYEEKNIKKGVLACIG